MAKLEDLIQLIADSRLRGEIAREVENLKEEKRFGLVFEEHIPELAQLPTLPVRSGTHVVKREGAGSETYLVQVAVDNEHVRLFREPNGPEEVAPVDELVVVKRFGEPIYPSLVSVDRVIRDPNQPYHVLINSDNFHALQLLLYCYAGKIDIIYIDPPYNTGARDWKYNNDYVDSNDAWRHSKWLAMMKKRLHLGMQLLKPRGIMCVTIDDNEMHHLQSLIERDFPQAEVLGVVAIKNSPSGRPSTRGFRVNHEYAIFVARGRAAEIGRLERSAEQRAFFREKDDQGDFAWVNLRKRGGANTLRTARPKQFYPIYVLGDRIRIPLLEWIKEERDWKVLEEPQEGEEVIYPIGNDGKERIWALGHETARQQLCELRVHLDNNGRTFIFRKQRLDGGSLPSTMWDKVEYSVVENGTVLLEKILGESQKFPFPKSLYAVMDCLLVAGAEKRDALILDFFAGSGTTLHATCLLNAEDGGQRQCILVTNNEVGEPTAKQLNAQGYWLGDPEYEQHGICESVTWPRCKYAITGRRDDGAELPGLYRSGHELGEGFEANLDYFRIDYLDPNDVAAGEKFEAVLPILWLIAGARGEREVSDGKCEWFIPQNSPFAVLVDEHHFRGFVRELKHRPDIRYVFLVTDSEDAYHEMRAELPGVYQTRMLYKSYLDNFKINTERIL